MVAETKIADKEEEARRTSNAEKGRALYEQTLRAKLEQEHLGKKVVIHPGSGDYMVSDRELPAVLEMRERYPGAIFYMRRIGPPTRADYQLIARMDADRLWSEAQKK